MSLFGLIIGLVGVAVLLWLVLSFVVARAHPCDPGDPVLVDEAAPPGYSLAGGTDGYGGPRNHDDS